MVDEASAAPRAATRTACVIAGATREEVQAIGMNERIAIRVNKVGVLVTGRPGDMIIDYAAELAGPVYDVMYNAGTGWFSVTVFKGLGQTVRWDNRPDTNPGYPRIDNVLGATLPMSILAVLDVPPDAIGYKPPLALG
ncbi:hypothetical protein BH11MYX2_BH11MYX2_40880 [soil metagenome]